MGSFESKRQMIKELNDSYEIIEGLLEIIKETTTNDVYCSILNNIQYYDEYGCIQCYEFHKRKNQGEQQ